MVLKEKVLHNFSIYTESQGLAKRPPLELVLGQAHSCMKLMSKSNIALAAFASVDHYLNSEWRLTSEHYVIM